ncbi:hypothetical protein [Fictibacillus sp. KU28468]|nr:hypothetical protein [Fictibacillus sp. KU28468]UZJ78251.1 hypothetical protein OKX00_19200 [Fictibacillus sp. KU28468]
MISVPGCSLLSARAPTFAGRAVSLFIARRKCEVHFRGVSHLPLQLTFH